MHPHVSPDWLALARAPQLALLLDLDGTLIPFATTPAEATLAPTTVDVLARLAAAGIQIVLVTGRSHEVAETELARLRGAWCVAEHGMWFHDGDGWAGASSDPELDGLFARLVALDAPGARVERKARSVCLHWRGVAVAAREALITAAELTCDEWLETHGDYERLDGVAMLEVRDRRAHKGMGVAWVLGRIPDARVLAIGDDLTDEDMFARTRPGDGAIVVGRALARRSLAHARLGDPDAVVGFLRWLLDARAGTTTAAPPALDLPRRREIAQRRLVVVSNRLPNLNPDARAREVGGLVAGLEPALRDHGGIWLGWSGQEREGDPRLRVDDDARPARAEFDLPPQWREHFYAGFCNRALWPLFHGFPGRVRFLDADWAAYVAANDAYARFALELADRDGMIWAHDYHLLLLARALRRAGYRGPLGLFMHVPFPALDLFETLPWAEELLDGMLAFDVVGFHTAHWADNFLDVARRLGRARIDDAQVERGGRRTHVGVFPLGIDAGAFGVGAAAAPAPDIAGLRAALGERRLILGVDRLDYSKGIPARLLAFEQLLERGPGWRGRVSFVQISVPSRADVPEYAELRERVENLVGRINGRFGEADWVPVRYLYRAYPAPVLAQLYRTADVGLVTPLRDGMNLVAKEFIAAQDPSAPGVLVLSRFAGAAVELRDAVITNPFHVDGMAADLDQALRMPPQVRVARHERLMRAVARHAPALWAASFLARLDEARGPA